jgi:hypothetical protein
MSGSTTSFDGLKALRWWRWMFVLVVVLFWTESNDWAKSASHFGYALWPLLLVMALFFLSPLVAIADASIAWSRHKEKEISPTMLQWRLLWAAFLLVNFAVFLGVVNWSR